MHQNAKYLFILIILISFVSGCKTTKDISTAVNTLFPKSEKTLEKKDYQKNKVVKKNNNDSTSCNDAFLKMFITYATKENSQQCFMEFNKKQYQRAYKICRPSAEKGDPFSQFVTATIYDEGLEVEQSFEQAFNWFKLAAEQGMVFPQFKLGIMYSEGLGTKQNYKKGFEWHLLAAEKGWCGSMHALGVMFDEGFGVPQSYKEAFKWYKKAAERGESLAQTNIGVMYAQGKGISKDYIKAHMWYNLASVQFDDQKSVYMTKNKSNVARLNKANLEKFMSPDQIVEAQELAKKCYENNYKDC